MSALRHFHEAHKERRQRMYAAAVKPRRPVLLLAAPSRAEDPLPEPAIVIPEKWKANRECVRTIMQAVCRPRGINIEMMSSPKRYRNIIPARHLSIWAVMTILQNTSLPWVGRQFKRDHSTILHAFRKIEAHRDEMSHEIRQIGDALGIPNLVMIKRDTSRFAGKNQNTMPHCE